MQRFNSKTKIVATLGPATSDKETLLRMIDAGVDVFRLNFSHSKKDDFLSKIKLIREINRENNLNISVLADLQGPKLRVGEIENSLLELNDGDIITFTTEKCIGTK